MEYGAIFPTCEIGSDPVFIRDYAQAAEDLGYKHITIYDHVVGASHQDRDPPLAGPYTENDPFHEPMVLLAYLAAVTQRIELATGVLIAPQRQAVLIAKQAMELYLLSEGRFRLTLGTGWNHVEYQALGVPFEKRGAILEEQVELIQQLWSQDEVDFHGQFHRVDRASILPRIEKGPALWFGGMAPVAVKRAARLGNGFMFGSCIDYMKGLCELLTGLLETNGRREGFKIDVPVSFAEGPDYWRREITAWEALGANTVAVRTMSTGSRHLGEADAGFTTPQQHIDALAQFMKEVRDC
jgi:probable F420-dependent oxidoreductase